MTYHGTNTWLADTEDGTIVIDPGPDNAAHVAAILAAAPTPITAILLTHTHPDHLGRRGQPARGHQGAPCSAGTRPGKAASLPTRRSPTGRASPA